MSRGDIILVPAVHTEGLTLGGGTVGLGGLFSSPGTGSGTSAGLGCPEGPIVRRKDRFASVKAFVLPDGAGPCISSQHQKMARKQAHRLLAISFKPPREHSPLSDPALACTG